MKRFISIAIILVFLCGFVGAADYYVKNGGNDGADGLSDGNAWATIAKVNSSMGSFNPGDTISFNRDDSWVTGQTPSLRITASGSAVGGYITFGAYGTGAKPLITHDSTGEGYGTLYGASDNLEYVKIENIEAKLVASTSAAVHFGRTGMANIYLSALDITESTQNGIFLQYVNTYTVINCTINTCSGTCLVVYGSPNPKITNGLIDGNTIDGSTGTDCISIHRDGSLNIVGSNHIIQNNTLIDAGEDALDLDGAPSVTGIVIQDNTVTGATNLAITVRGNGTICRRNYIYDTGEHGIYVHNSTDGADIHHNIVTNPGKCCLQTATSAGTIANVNVYNNVFKEGAATTRSVIRFSQASTPSGFIFKNNIIWGEDYKLVEYEGAMTPTTTSSTFDYNLYWDSGADGIFYANSTSYNFATWKATFSQDANSPAMADPAFTNGNGDYSADTDFTIPTGSPCKDAGVNVGLGTCYFGVTIPSGAAPDIGAHEYDQGDTPHNMILKPGVILLLKSGVTIIKK